MNLPVSFNIAITLKTIENAFRKSVAELHLELPAEAFGILMITYFHNDIIQQDIAEMANKDKSAVLRYIDLLEGKGMVQRQPDGNDRRKNRIIITDSGKKIAQILIEKEYDLFLKLSQGTDIHEMEIFNKVLCVLRNNAEGV